MDAWHSPERANPRRETWLIIFILDESVIQTNNSSGSFLKSQMQLRQARRATLLQRFLERGMNEGCRGGGAKRMQIG